MDAWHVCGCRVSRQPTPGPLRRASGMLTRPSIRTWVREAEPVAARERTAASRLRELTLHELIASFAGRTFCWALPHEPGTTILAPRRHHLCVIWRRNAYDAGTAHK